MVITSKSILKVETFNLELVHLPNDEKMTLVSKFDFKSPDIRIFSKFKTPNLDVIEVDSELFQVE